MRLVNKVVYLSPATKLQRCSAGRKLDSTPGRVLTGSWLVEERNKGVEGIHKSHHE
jgi:hypothetical protein